MPLIGDIHGEFVGLAWDLDFDVRPQECPDPRSVDKDVSALTQSDRQHQSRAVAEESGRDLVDAGLQQARQPILTGIAHHRQDREDGADRHVDIDVDRAVEGVDGDRQRRRGVEQGWLLGFSGCEDRNRGRADLVEKAVVAVPFQGLLLRTDVGVGALSVRGRDSLCGRMDLTADADRGARQSQDRRADGGAATGFFKPVLEGLSRHGRSFPGCAAVPACRTSPGHQRAQDR